MESDWTSWVEEKYVDVRRNINGKFLDFWAGSHELGSQKETKRNVTRLPGWKQKTRMFDGVQMETSWKSGLEAKNTEVRRKLNGM